MSATLVVILDTRRMKIKTGKFPVKLRVTFKRVTKDYQTVFEMTKDDYKKLSASRILEELKFVRDKLKEIERTAANAIVELQPFSFNEFEKDFILNNRFFKSRKFKEPDFPSDTNNFDFTPYHKKFLIFSEDHSKPGTISTVYFSYIKKLLLEERIGSAFNYKDSYNSLK